MLRVIEYTLFFLAVTVLQVFLFNNLNLGIYIHPLVYIAFIILLPMETLPVVVLGLGLLSGVIMDISTGSGGLYTITTVFTSFVRPYLLPLILGRDEVKEGGIPMPSRIGYGKFFRYAGIIVFLQCLIFFTFESLAFKYYYLTLLRILASSVVTVGLVFFTQMVLSGARDRSPSQTYQ